MSSILETGPNDWPLAMRNVTRDETATRRYVPVQNTQKTEWSKHQDQRLNTRPTKTQLSNMLRNMKGTNTVAPQDNTPRATRHIQGYQVTEKSQIIMNNTVLNTSLGHPSEPTDSQMKDQNFHPKNRWTGENATGYEFIGQTPKSPGNLLKDKFQLESNPSSPRKKKKRKSNGQKSKERSDSMSSSSSLSSSQVSHVLPEIPGTIPVSPNLQKRFYEALLMLSILDKNQGERLDEDEPPDLDDNFSDLDTTKLTRAFLKSLAYICDYEKGGVTTTAIALERRHDKVVYWLASNKNPRQANDDARDHTLNLLKEILDMLRGVERSNYTIILAEVFKRAVNFSSERIGFYTKWLKNHIKDVLNEPEIANNKDEAEFISWLEKVQMVADNSEEICKLCYRERDSHQYRWLRYHATEGETCAGRFKKIHHFMGRLHHTCKAADTVVFGALTLRKLLDDFEVSRVNSPPSLKPPLEERNPTLVELAGRVVGEDKVEELREDLKYLDSNFHIGKVLENRCTKPPSRQVVHAEIILLDLFWRRKLDFVGEDRYVASSKPACYCCRLYIQEHPGEFVLPASHNNCYINWRVPDIYIPDDNPEDPDHVNAIKVRDAILNRMTHKIREVFLRRVKQRKGPVPSVRDSLTQISSARVRHGGPDGLAIPEEDLFVEKMTSLSISDSSSTEEEERQDSREIESNIESREKENSGNK